jgi:DNA-binding response OmpR family regulator
MADVPNLPLILVADDDWMNREMMQVYLQRAGFRVAAAHDGASAIQQAMIETPDLVLLDVRMGEIDGYDVCAQMKTMDTLKTTPILMLSALSSQDAVDSAMKAGADGFITKTMNLSQVVQTIREKLPNAQ